ncbi:hypothetical protein SCP_0501670 [Sparassis crispa]|uniref:Uncharacterized protein n=1 Tax=Sparassis crispa TaxID=139825 RepID=A0A401GLT0_9APHY|nr:hypothetical protein SCP_0501670 [Sparassis crispa]GBE83120.1 hypothetical protein SCP_0501670 [Sparassis crispa]
MADAAGCRILVISSTMEQGQQFVQRVKGLSIANVSDLSSADLASNSIPWTIANKYYTADVHFETRVFQDFRSHHAVGVPAVIYVWAHGEPYREHVPDIAKSLEYYDPEVTLAVRFDGNTAKANADEDDGLDEFLSSHGFEFIEGDRSARKPTQDSGRVLDDEDEGIPGLPRVVDALSTIMWPSLVQSDSTRQRRSRARELLDWARDEEEDDGLRALISDAGASEHAQTSSPRNERKSRMQREMEELERWLDEADEDRATGHAAAWGASEHAMWSDRPLEVATPTIVTPTAEEYGFDDDFTEFVSAPPRQLSDVYDSRGLVPMDTGASYRSLASGSDISNGHYESIDQDDYENDPDLPSHAEIAETSRRIFGSPAVSSLPGTSPNLRRGASTGSSADEDHPFEHDADDDEFEMSPFDLSRVLGALHNMKEEIAGMQNEDERRRAAARVALGLVYGLQADRDDEHEHS